MMMSNPLGPVVLATLDRNALSLTALEDLNPLTRSRNVGRLPKPLRPLGTPAVSPRSWKRRAYFHSVIVRLPWSRRLCREDGYDLNHKGGTRKSNLPRSSSPQRCLGIRPQRETLLVR